MFRAVYCIIFFYCLLTIPAFSQTIRLELDSVTINTLQPIKESPHRYDLADPILVAGKFTYDGIIQPIVLMDREGNWHKVPYWEGLMKELSSRYFNYIAYSKNASSPVSTGRIVRFSFEVSEFMGFLGYCKEQKPENPCMVREGSGGIVLTWEDTPAFFEPKKETVEAEAFQYHNLVLEAFLEAETKHIKETTHYERNGRFYTRNGGIPVYKPERDSASIQITYVQSGALKDSLSLIQVQAKREFRDKSIGSCSKSTQVGFLLVNGEESTYVHDYYFAGECSGKTSFQPSEPTAAFTYKGRLFIMEDHYGYEGMSTTVTEVTLDQ